MTPTLDDNHEMIKVPLKDEPGWSVKCSCGSIDVVVLSDVNFPPGAARHFLLNEVWPFDAPPKSPKWPHNTPEDDALDKEE